ncbi:anion-transporting ArsA/GET3 family ATPase [Stackebrandtia albiflava]|uniref:Anion-transporting ArsA/GET3 family ATPase n=1 Tax=Stackebrandtia albiflava TaxID=406432 RepID=A0A562UYB3_9ACTN|nr:ArsA family ATPase [Stackebrandtia albiflava]TWJ10596.1 anion-transporting ArsA/GET3 family ATPase [Stackebrandtia albiflava]
MTRSKVLDTDALIGDPQTRVVVCCGSGGVGKTTTAASLALRAAERFGRRTVVLTIDPARRLAQSLGLAELDNAPRRVEKVVDGSLDAMMLDMKRTFDEVVLAHTTREQADEIFANPFYQAMSGTFAGTQEYMAMEKLAQLRARDEWDLIVVDTPPSRSALDFLDAPARLARFLDGRMMRLLTSSSRGGHSVFSLMTSSMSFFTRTINKVIGGRLLSDIGTFAASLDSTFGGFRTRAEATFKALQNPQTAFLVVAAPEPDAIREAVYFTRRLTEERMPLAGLVLNRSHSVAATGLSAERAMGAVEALEDSGDDTPTADVLRVHSRLVSQVATETRIAARFTAACPDVPQARVPAFAADVHDLEDLRAVAEALAGSGSAPP